MTAARYADYVKDLRVLFAELDGQPDLFQTFDLHVELAAAGRLVVYETSRRKGLIDSLYYGRSGPDESNRQIAQKAAFAAIDHFMALGQFLALDGSAGAMDGDPFQGLTAIGSQYPSCAFRFAYRKKGQPMARSMAMIFVGFNDDQDAVRYAEALPDPSVLVRERPFRTEKLFEWK
ncbi:hypothetical protein [Rhizobium sp. CAU 1783]